MKLTLLVGPPGSGKSTLAKPQCAIEGAVYINQDSQGREGHLENFKKAISEGKSIVVDRMGFNRDQRNRYLDPAKAAGYETEIIVLHQPYSVCLERVCARTNHETIKDEASARGALGLFFSKYERVQDNEANKITRIWPDGPKEMAIYSDLDGTLCDVEHRRHFVRPPANTLVGPDGSMVNVFGDLDPWPLDKPLPKFKKNWKNFFKNLSYDPVNKPVMEVLKKFSKDGYSIVYATGRPDNYKRETAIWLHDNDAPVGHLFMRRRDDNRDDDIVKEIILDFEILTRYNVLFCLDDRDQVVRMLRKRGLTVFQVADGDF